MRFPVSPLVFNFVIDSVLDRALQLNDCQGVELLPSGYRAELNYANDGLLLIDDTTKFQRLFDRLTKSAGMLVMRFASSKWEVLVHN